MQRCSITTPQQQLMPQSAFLVGLAPNSLPEFGLACSSTELSCRVLLHFDALEAAVIYRLR